jgi:S-DNA-T family DNA segregation ATPase FtsK/SpoIIIE
MPTIDLLKEYGNEEIAINKDELEENKNKIVGLLKNFNVGIAEIKATIGNGYALRNCSRSGN